MKIQRTADYIDACIMRILGDWRKTANDYPDWDRTLPPVLDVEMDLYDMVRKVRHDKSKNCGSY